MAQGYPGPVFPVPGVGVKPTALPGRTERGSTTSEQVLLLSVVLVALLGVAPVFVRLLEEGILGLSLDVVEMLTGRRSPPDSPAGGGPDAPPSGGDGPPRGDIPQHPHHPGEDSGSSQEGGDPEENAPPPASDEGAEDPPPPEEEDSTCPYVYDESSERWRDPETGQYVSSAEASQAGC